MDKQNVDPNEEGVEIKLKNYIENHRKKGLSDKEIAELLTKQGFDDDVIERLFSQPIQEKDPFLINVIFRIVRLFVITGIVASVILGLSEGIKIGTHIFMPSMILILVVGGGIGVLVYGLLSMLENIIIKATRRKTKKGI